MIGKIHSAVTVLLLVSVLRSFSQNKNYYVDATGGSDANTGLSPLAAWKTVEKVNTSTFVPGDSILFKRGEAFRGSLMPASGSPAGDITYSAYGSGNKPKLLGAYDRSSPSDWTNQGGNIWRTMSRSVNSVGNELLLNSDFSSDLSGWGLYSDPATGASATLSRTTTSGEFVSSPGGARIICANQGNGSNPWNTDIQVSASTGSITINKWYRFSFKAKSTRPFTIPADRIQLHQHDAPWSRYSSTLSTPKAITGAWSSYETYFKASTTSASDGCNVMYYLGSVIPTGDTLYIDACSFMECEKDPELLSVDVGNILFNNEASWGVLVWNRSDLNAQGKFWYDEDNDLLEMYSTVNPGSYYSHIEVAMDWDLISAINKSYFICEYLDIRDCGGNGFQVMTVHHSWVKNCDFSFIGGGNIGGPPRSRGGNGATFWKDNHDNFVERCTFNQIYDGAMSAQGIDTAEFEVYNLHFRNNIINNAEHTIEYWEDAPKAIAHDIYFENNTFLNAGGGWSHTQRPNPDGTHVWYGNNTAKTWNVFFRNNIFYNSADEGIHWWVKEQINKVTFDHNCWYESSGFLARIEVALSIGLYDKTYDFATQWDEYRADTKQDSNSLHADPLLNADLTLQASSPCIDAGKTLTTLLTDFGGSARPQGTGYDIGAFEAPASLLASPVLIVPSDNSKRMTIAPVLTWAKTRRATKYRLVVSLSPDFSSSAVVDSTTADTTLTIQPLQYGTIYYWRVQAASTIGTSDWSQVRSFTTIAETPTGQAYYVAPNGDDSNPGTDSRPWKTLAKATSMASAGVTVYLKKGTYAERLLPIYSGTADGPITFTSYPGDSATITGTGLTPPSGWWAGLVWLQNLKYIKISGLRIENSPNVGIDAENCSYITIEKNYVDSTDSPGIKVYSSDHIIVDGNEVVHGCLTLDNESISIALVDNFEIKNNVVHDGLTEGIDVKVGSSNGIVTKNLTYNLNERAGIYLDAWDRRQYNIEVFDNISHDNGMGITFGAENGGLLEAIKVHNNKSYRIRQWAFAIVGMGIGQTHSFKNIELYANQSSEGEMGLEIAGFSGTSFDSLNIHNNVFFHNGTTGISIGRFDQAPGFYIMRNIFLTNNTLFRNGTFSNGWGDGGINITNFSPENFFIRNNLFSGNAAYTLCVQGDVTGGTGVTIEYNFFDGFKNAPYEKAGLNPSFGSAMFVDTMIHDLHLQPASPAIDKGHPDPVYNDPPDRNRPGFALYPAQGTVRNDLGAYGGRFGGAWDLAASVTKPQLPVLTSPADSGRAVSITPMLTWQGSLGTDRYRVQLSTSPNFGNKVVDDSMETDCYRQVGPLQNNTAYYWRVSATNVGGTSSFSAIRTFTTVVAAPVVPFLAGPPDSTTNVQLTTTLSWIAAQGASVYHLQVSTASNFGSRVVDDSTISSISTSVGPLTLATTYCWRVRAKNEGGWSVWTSARQFSTIRTTSVEQLSGEIPTVYSLSQNYPNPFNPSTRIRFGIPKSGKVSLKIFDLLGRELETLVEEELAPAYYEAVWKANVASGIYFYTIQAGDASTSSAQCFVQTRKMILIH